MTKTSSLLTLQRPKSTLNFRQLSVPSNLFFEFRLIDQGGDWDRRNRLKVYRGLHLLSIRQFKRGGELLLDALSTFTATELISYNNFVVLTTIAGVLTLSRVDLKKKVCLEVLVRQGDTDVIQTSSLTHPRSTRSSRKCLSSQTSSKACTTLTMTSSSLR